MTEYRKKLIEVAMPLEAINRESAREKSIRHGHPSTLHLWWARRPLASCRAVLFGQLVDDPSSWPERFPTEEEQDAEPKRLFGILEELELWEQYCREEGIAGSVEGFPRSEDAELAARARAALQLRASRLHRPTPPGRSSARSLSGAVVSARHWHIRERRLRRRDQAVGYQRARGRL